MDIAVNAIAVVIVLLCGVFVTGACVVIGLVLISLYRRWRDG